MMEPDDSSPQPKSWLDRLSHAFHSEPKNREDLRQLLKDAADRNLLDDEALAMINGVMSVSTMQVRDIMIPRAQMAYVEKDQNPAEFLPRIVNTAHSRFPVIGEDKDDVIGILLAKDLLKHFITHPDRPLRLSDDLIRPAFFVPESKRLDTLLKEFRSSHNHLAIVVDEYGGIAGMVTIEDVLEEIVGDIEDEYDCDETAEWIQQQDEHNYLVNALTLIEDFNAYFHTNYSDEVADTIGGMITHHLGHVPKTKETVELDRFTFTVHTADNRRIIALHVHIHEVSPETEPND